MLDDLRSDGGLGGTEGQHHRAPRRSDRERPIADREVPLSRQEQDARVLAPAVMSALWTLAALAAFDEALAIFHVIAALLVIGVGVNYMLFAVPAKGEDLSDTAVVSLAVVSATTLCAFGAMATSSIPVLDALGKTVTLGVVATLLACALLIGAMRSAR